jgi:hypothetical protein
VQLNRSRSADLLWNGDLSSRPSRSQLGAFIYAQLSKTTGNQFDTILTKRSDRPSKAAPNLHRRTFFRTARFEKARRRVMHDITWFNPDENQVSDRRRPSNYGLLLTAEARMSAPPPKASSLQNSISTRKPMPVQKAPKLPRDGLLIILTDLLQLPTQGETWQRPYRLSVHRQPSGVYRRVKMLRCDIRDVRPSSIGIPWN